MDEVTKEEFEIAMTEAYNEYKENDGEKCIPLTVAFVREKGVEQALNGLRKIRELFCQFTDEVEKLKDSNDKDVEKVLKLMEVDGFEKYWRYILKEENSKRSK